MSEPTPPVIPDSDSTIMIPRPGGKRAPGVQDVQTYTPAPAMRDEPQADSRPSGVNPLVAAANRILNLAPQLRSTLSHPDPQGLREYLLREIGEFEQEARHSGVAPEKIMVARYTLCTVIDETISMTPWGVPSQWAQNSLLVTLHKEAWGGEKFFLLLNKMAEDPQRNLDLLELMYACMSLGFEGRYRVIDNGKAQLEQLRGRIYEIIRRERGEFERDLSSHWRGAARKPQALVRKIPVWVVLSASAFVLFAVFLTLTILLNQSSDPVFSTLAGIRANTADLQRPAAPLAKPRLRQFLANEIAQGLVDVTEDAQTSRVTIRSDNLFEPGSAEANSAISPLLLRIADALNQVEGSVVVEGHTDDRPIRSLRFPSNYQLSLARANSVTRLLAQRLSNLGRMKTEGMADAQPVAPNDTPVNRARNRRVEITLRVSAGT